MCVDICSVSTMNHRLITFTALREKKKLNRKLLRPPPSLVFERPGSLHKCFPQYFLLPPFFLSPHFYSQPSTWPPSVLWNLPKSPLGPPSFSWTITLVAAPPSLTVHLIGRGPNKNPQRSSNLFHKRRYNGEIKTK